MNRLGCTSLICLTAAAAALSSCGMRSNAAVAAAVHSQSPETETPELPEEEDDYVYYGDTLCTYGDRTVMYDYVDDHSEASETPWNVVVSTLKDSTLLHTCRVINGGICSADGHTLKIAIGVDTLSYDVRNLPDTIYPLKDVSPANSVEHKLSRFFALSDKMWKCSFIFSAYLPADHPAWINKFITVELDDYMKSWFADEGNKRDPLSKYNGLISGVSKVRGLDSAGSTPKAIAGYFAKDYERRYRKEFLDLGEDPDDTEAWGPKYDYYMELSPAWTDDDGKLSTYRLYTYNYGGGAHGMMYENYITFDNATGRILGIKDIFGENGYRQAIDAVGRKLSGWLSEERGSEMEMTADVVEAGEFDSDFYSTLHYETIDGLVYPRPAITHRGVVFSYQPYENGSFADGIRHFIIPAPQ